MLSPEQLAYIERKKLVKLQGYGEDALYQTLWGARTVANAMEMEIIQSHHFTKLVAERAKPEVKPIVVGDEFMVRHLCCADEHGCGLFGE